MTMLEIPASAGVGSYELEFDGVNQTLSSGATIDFTLFAAGGVNNFRLWPSVPGNPIPQVAGFQFFNNGPTQVLQGRATEPGDANLDGIVDGGDYTIWADHYAEAVSASAIPEPSTFVLAACGGLGLLVAGCRRRSPR